MYMYSREILRNLCNRNPKQIDPLRCGVLWSLINRL